MLEAWSNPYARVAESDESDAEKAMYGTLMEFDVDVSAMSTDIRAQYIN